MSILFIRLFFVTFKIILINLEALFEITIDTINCFYNPILKKVNESK